MLSVSPPSAALKETQRLSFCLPVKAWHLLPAAEYTAHNEGGHFTVPLGGAGVIWRLLEECYGGDTVCPRNVLRSAGGGSSRCFAVNSWVMALLIKGEIIKLLVTYSILSLGTSE